MRLTLHAVMHLLVDGVCAATLYLYCAGEDGFALLVLLYNTLAFTTQCAVGLLTDRCRDRRKCTAASALAVALGFLLPLPALGRVLLVGLGNSLFHVSGGTETLLAAGDRAWPLGVFVAPGAVGLTLGMLFPRLGAWFAVALVLTGVLAARLPVPPARPASAAPAREAPLAVPLVLLIAVAVRALGGTAAVFPWKTGMAATLLTTLFVFAGKTAGGFAMDRWGPVPTAALSIIPAALLIAFGSGSMALSLAGQLLLNLTMPVTLLLIYRALPGAPGFSFGLAASVLWPGTLAGQMLTLTGPLLWVSVLLCFLSGLAAILWAVRRLKAYEMGEDRR